MIDIKTVDLTNKVFGHLTVVKLNYQDNRGSSWLCKCDCGNEIVLQKSRLIGLPKRKPDKSCGCERHTQKGNTIKYKRIYGIYKCMVNRCNNPKTDNYERYGGKGIRVCKEWENDFQPFLEWTLENGYAEKLTIDRINPLKDYSPSNCRWADYFIQEQNRSLNKNNKLKHKGVCTSGKTHFRAHITRDGVKKHLGSFETIEKAIQARKDAENYYNEFHKLQCNNYSN